MGRRGWIGRKRGGEMFVVGGGNSKLFLSHVSQNELWGGDRGGDRGGVIEGRMTYFTPNGRMKSQGVVRLGEVKRTGCLRRFETHEGRAARR